MSDQNQRVKRKWLGVMKGLRERLPADTILRWFSAVQFEAVEDGIAVLSVPNNIYQYWIESNHSVALLAALRSVDPNIHEFAIRVRLATAKRRARRRIKQAPRKVFISYSHRDSAFVERLMVHLRPLDRDFVIETWTDRSIRPGADWRDELQKAISNANIVILLLSADFLASEFIMNEELPSLLHKAETKGTIVLPVICKPCRYLRTPELARFQALNDPNEPLLKMDEVDREAVFNQIAEAVEDACKR